MIQSNKIGVAINSYDPVAYFTDGKAEKGNSMYSYKWMGAEWYFISESDMKMFKENPNKYTPAYGGNCAYAVGRGALVSGDPHAWTIKDGRLYLNKNNDTKKLFKKNLESNIKSADKEWSMMNTHEGETEKMMKSKTDSK
jgi:YHS domain-containing protein